MGEQSLTVAQFVAPEDIRIDQWVAVLSVTCEFLPTWAIDSPSDIDGLRAVRYTYAPEQAGEPLRVVDVCVPFVLVEDAQGKPQVLDLRMCTLVAVSNRFAKAVRKPRRPVKGRKSRSRVDTL